MPIQRMHIEAWCETCEEMHDIHRVIIVEGEGIRSPVTFDGIDVYRLPSPQCKVVGQPHITLIDHDNWQTIFKLDDIYAETNRRGHEGDNT